MPAEITEVAIRAPRPSAWASSPTPPCASAARRARWPASSGTTSRPTARARQGRLATTTRARCRPPLAPRALRGDGQPTPSSSRPRELARRGRPAALARARRSRSGRAAVEELRPGGGRRWRVRASAMGRPGADGAGPLGVPVRRLQALHERRLPGRVPDGRADPDGVRDGDRAAGRLQRLRLLRRLVPVRRDRPRPYDGRAAKCTLCYDRLQDGLEPACAKACPTDSIQFGYEELVETAKRRVVARPRSRCGRAAAPTCRQSSSPPRSPRRRPRTASSWWPRASRPTIRRGGHWATWRRWR